MILKTHIQEKKLKRISENGYENNKRRKADLTGGKERNEIKLKQAQRTSTPVRKKRIDCGEQMNKAVSASWKELVNRDGITC